MRRVRSRRRAGRVDAGAAWISYSDMMAALLLVFVLVLCYSVYQYFVMLETKSAEIDEKGVLLASQQQTLDDQQAKLTAQQKTLDDANAALLTKQTQLDGALTELTEQRGLLEAQALTLQEQQTTIDDAKAELSDKEEALSLAQSEIADREIRLQAASSLLEQQQTTLLTQQQRLDDLVGVRTKIIVALSNALSASNIKASVDKNTGDIVLESTVFFDVGKDAIKESGQTLLNRFIPIYLSVLLCDEYADYLGEIIIEGHTDTQGTYLNNLKLSQERALSVASYCLGMNGLTEQQRTLLRQILTAKGRSYSDPVYAADGSIDMDASRRVEFKFRLKDSEMIDSIREILANETAQTINAQ